MFTIPSPYIKRITTILKEYDTLAHQNPTELKSQIPAHEMWRFFIDGCLQNGRGLAQGHFFQQSQLLTHTIKEYVENQEKLNLEDEEIWFKSPLLQFLKSHRWFLTQHECATLTLADLLALDRGWLPFEINEPGYTKALVNAFQTLFDFSIDVDNQLNKRLHALATHKVKHTEYEDEEDDRPGEFRSAESAHFRFGNTTVTEAGIKQILERGNSQLSFSLTLFDHENRMSIGSVSINSESIKTIREYFANLKYNHENGITSYGEITFRKYCISPDMIGLIQQIKDNHSVIYNLLNTLAETQNESQLAHVLAKQIAEKNNSYSFSLMSDQPYKTRRTLESTMGKYQEIYHLAIDMANNPLQKLLAIIHYVQACERTHAFVDCNTRTNMLLLNHLLMRHGFPPVILNNPNQIATSSDMEAIELVLEGMENTLKLAQGQKLFNIDTQDILEFIGSNERTRDKFDYFQEIIAIEESMRSEQRIGMQQTKN